MAQHRSAAGELAPALAHHAEAVCRHYLSAGRRCGHYWTVGDVANSPGRSLYVRLTGPVSGKGAAGRWCDAATGEYGDLLDLIALTSGFGSLRNAMDEARAFLALPRPEPKPISDAGQVARSRETVETARRQFRSGQPLRGTTAERYLENHGLSIADVDTSALRFHPGAYYRETSESPRQTWPALLAKVTDRGGMITGIHRTWLDPVRLGRAPISSPPRALGHLVGNGVRFGPRTGPVLLAGEGIETVLSLTAVLPRVGMVAALSATHLALLELPPGLVTLLIAQDNDRAGRHAAEQLHHRAEAADISAHVLRPRLIDFSSPPVAVGSPERPRAPRSQPQPLRSTP